METLKHLIKFFLQIAVAFFLFALLWWIASIFFPALNFRTLIPAFSKTGTTTDILPPPKNYSGLFAQKNNVYSGNEYVSGPAYNGYGNVNNTNNANGFNNTYTYSSSSYVTYSSTGSTNDTTGVYNPKTGVMEYASTITTQQAVSSTTPSQAKPQPVIVRGLYVRNLSLYDRGHIYTGLTFIGEARSTMFKDGKFPIVVIDSNNKVIGISAAFATTDWTVAGWTRFQTKIEYPIPGGMPCMMIFEEALTQVERTRQPVRVAMPIQCN